MVSIPFFRICLAESRIKEGLKLPRTNIDSFTGSNFTRTIHNSSYPFIASSNHSGRHVLITGGSRGIGRAIALSFARAGAAAIVIGELANFDTAQLTKEICSAAAEAGRHSLLPPTVLHIRLDVTDSNSVRAAAEEVNAILNGKLDIIVNNAGFMTPALPVPASDEDTWWRTFEVNLKGPYLIAKYFLPLLLRSGDDNEEAAAALKTVVNINSVASHNLRPHASAYGTSKLAVLRLTEFLLIEAADKGLLAYSVHPGGVLTELAEKGMPKTTLAALGDAPELAGDTVAWLTQQRRDWLAGRYLSCTWDMEELMAKKVYVVAKDLLKVKLVLD